MHYFHLKKNLKNSSYFFKSVFPKFAHFFSYFFRKNPRWPPKRFQFFSIFLVFLTYHATTHSEMVNLATCTHFSGYWQNDPQDPLIIETIPSLCPVSMVSSEDAKCDTGWTLYSGSCYKLSDITTDWSTAVDNCKTEGAMLVLPRDQAENSFISDTYYYAGWVIFTWPKNIVFGQVLFSSACMCLCVCVSVCLCVCLCVCWLIISKSSRPILMKLCRMMYNDNISDPFEDEMNQSSRTEVTESLYLYFFLLRPLKIFFWCYFPFFVIGEVKCH